MAQAPGAGGGACDRAIGSPQRTVLLVAFHFPPLKLSSGLERTLAFCRHLPRFGWQANVLSASPRAYETVSEERVSDIPAGVIVQRAFARDAARHFSIGGSYPRWAALPDRWTSWLLGAVPAGWRMARAGRADAIWSTYPIATAHLIGCALARLTKLPWIADFRDPMVEIDLLTNTMYPSDPAVRVARLWVERLVARHAAAVVFCTRQAADIFAARHPTVAAERVHVIPNGYDEAAFTALAQAPSRTSHTITLVHSGVLYPGPDRDPGAFLRAVRALLDESPSWRSRLRVVLRASGLEAQYRKLIDELQLADCVQLAPAIPYRDALAEMLAADGLLLFQGPASNPAIPAKLYEYLRAQRPILAMVDPEGATAGLLREQSTGMLAPIDDAAQIRVALGTFLDRLERSEVPVLELAKAQRFERAERAADLAGLLNRVSASHSRSALGAARL